MSKQDDKKQSKRIRKAILRRLKRCNENKARSGMAAKEWMAEQKMPIVDGIRIDIDALCKELWARPDGAFKLHTKQQVLDMLEDGFEEGILEHDQCNAVDGDGTICLNKASRCIIEGDTRAFVCKHHHTLYKSAKANSTGDN